MEQPGMQKGVFIVMSPEDVKEIVNKSNGQIPALPQFDTAIIGILNRFHMPPVIAYDFDKCMQISVDDSDDPEQAMEKTLDICERRHDCVFISVMRSAYENNREDECTEFFEEDEETMEPISVTLP